MYNYDLKQNEVFHVIKLIGYSSSCIHTHIYTRDVHFWQKYYSIFADKNSNIIRKSVNQETHARTRAHMHEHRRHAHTMTQEEVFYDLYEINWFNSTTAPSSAINIKLFQRRLTKCAENSCQLSRFHTLLPVYTRTHATHPISHGKK